MKRLTVTLAALTLMTGCGMVGHELANHLGIQSVSRMEDPFAQGPLVLYLGLSPQQRAAIKSVVTQQRNQAPHREELKALLLEPQVDTGKLQAFIEARLEERAAIIERTLPALVAIREILTPEQRSKLQILKSDTGPVAWAIQARAGQGPLKPLLEGIALTPEQQTAADNLKREILARRQQREAVRNAFFTFMQDGDAASFKTSLNAYQPNPPVGAILKMATALNQEQRQTIADRVQRHFVQ